MKKIPAISVIIPLYNAEKYIGECLDSLLAQTFKNFEVIVVDDCSTDKSVEVVKSYAPKFKGQLKFIKTKKNSGNPGVPRNFGLKFSRGEYVYFMDDDDLIVKNGLEEMHKFAKNFKADVVYMYKYFTKTEDASGKLTVNSFIKEDLQKEPLILEGNISARLNLFLKGNLRVMPWLKFLKRDFLIGEEITFPKIKVSEDDFWTIEVLCRAKKIVLISNAFYVNRNTPTSLTRKKKSASELIKYHMTPLIEGEKFFYKIINENEFFQKNPQYAYAWIEKLARYCFQTILPACASLKTLEVYEIFKQSFSGDCGKRNFLQNYLCSLINTQQKQLFWMQQKVNQLAVQTQQRISYLEKIPAVSVIIPLYNAEKYIGELLDSILAQTFQNFEVIVVNDCSTDNSVEVVKSYESKFGERLKLANTKKNTGGPAEPSNIGIYVSRGEYLLILDNDDTITPTALEELYNVAKNFNADVVACEKYYQIPDKFWNNMEIRKQIKPYSYQKCAFVTEPTLISDDLFERVKDVYQKKFLWNIWSKLLRRDFLTENRIHFNQNMIQDVVFTCCLLFTAKRYVRVPSTINYYRYVENSLSHMEESPDEILLRYVRTLKSGFSFLDEFLNEQEFFIHNPKEKYIALEVFVREALKYLKKVYAGNPSYIFDNLLHKEFKHEDNSALMAFIFSAENIHRVLLENFQTRIAQDQKHIAELENEIRRLKGIN